LIYMPVEEKACFVMQCVLKHLVYSFNQLLRLPNTLADSTYPNCRQHKSLRTEAY
jgi:hypothetical protein